MGTHTHTYISTRIHTHAHAHAYPHTHATNTHFHAHTRPHNHTHLKAQQRCAWTAGYELEKRTFLLCSCARGRTRARTHTHTLKERIFNLCWIFSLPTSLGKSKMQMNTPTIICSHAYAQKHAPVHTQEHTYLGSQSLNNFPEFAHRGIQTVKTSRVHRVLNVCIYIYTNVYMNLYVHVYMYVCVYIYT